MGERKEKGADLEMVDAELSVAVRRDQREFGSSLLEPMTSALAGPRRCWALAEVRVASEVACCSAEHSLADGQQNLDTLVVGSAHVGKGGTNLAYVLCGAWYVEDQERSDCLSRCDCVAKRK